MVIARALLDDVVSHARAEFDAECCGVIAVEADGSGAGGPARAARVHRATNVHASPLKFEIAPGELLKLWQECQRDGCDLGAIYHSHTRTDPYPSQTDINFAARWPDVEWLIVGLAKGEAEVRCYLIEEGEVREVPLEVR
jgi:proteasome lid subunit RPN8/RPN11